MSSLKLWQLKTIFILGWRCYGLCKPRKTNWARAFVPPGAKTFEDYKERRSSYSEDFEPLLSSNGIVWNNLWFFVSFYLICYTHTYTPSHTPVIFELLDFWNTRIFIIIFIIHIMLVCNKYRSIFWVIQEVQEKTSSLLTRHCLNFSKCFLSDGFCLATSSVRSCLGICKSSCLSSSNTCGFHWKK